jgi:beta-lactamase class D
MIANKLNPCAKTPISSVSVIARRLCDEAISRQQGLHILREITSFLAMTFGIRQQFTTNPFVIEQLSHFAIEQLLPLRHNTRHMYRFSLFIAVLATITFSSCRDSRIHEHEDWGKKFEARGITKACFILRDNNHEAVHYYNKKRCLERFSPASTFKIFNSLAALESATALDETLVIKWDSVNRWNADWNRDMNMREAFKVSNVGYYQELARRIGPDYMQHYLDTANYGNKSIGGGIDQFWLNDSLQISADEQVGFLKRLYFAELPMSERSQRIVKSMMLQEEDSTYRLFYKTGWAKLPAKQVLWVVGFVEKIEHMKEHKNSMNKSNQRMYPYFFAQNFEVGVSDTTQNWAKIRIDIMKDVLTDFGALPKQ